MNAPMPTPTRGRKRVHADNAARQAAYNEKRRLVLSDLERLFDVLATACEAGRSAKLTNNLPENIHERVLELTRRLENKRVILCNAEKKAVPALPLENTTDEPADQD